MTMVPYSPIIGIFPDADRAARAINELYALGLKNDQIGYVVPAGEGEEAGEKGRQVASGEVVGAAGGLQGAGASQLIPGVGPAIAGGILIATLGGAGDWGCGRWYYRSAGQDGYA